MRMHDKWRAFATLLALINLADAQGTRGAWRTVDAFFARWQELHDNEGFTVTDCYGEVVAVVRNVGDAMRVARNRVKNYWLA